jgi:hypothetical protein
MSRQDQATAQASVICRVDPGPGRTGNTQWVEKVSRPDTRHEVGRFYKKPAAREP